MKVVVPKVKTLSKNDIDNNYKLINSFSNILFCNDIKFILKTIKTIQNNNAINYQLEQHKNHHFKTKSFHTRFKM